MKKKKSMLSILGILVLSFSFVSGVSAQNEDPGPGGSPNKCVRLGICLGN